MVSGWELVTSRAGGDGSSGGVAGPRLPVLGTLCCTITATHVWPEMEMIMSNTNDTFRELTSNELDAVSGGANACGSGPLDCVALFTTLGDTVGGGGGGGGVTTPAGAWNDCLHGYGFPSMA